LKLNQHICPSAWNNQRYGFFFGFCVFRLPAHADISLFKDNLLSQVVSGGQRLFVDRWQSVSGFP
jgi:hypothetical protein